MSASGSDPRLPAVGDSDPASLDRAEATLIVTQVLPSGDGLSAAILHCCAAVELDWDLRQRSRFTCRDTLGRTVAVFLSRGTVLRGGDVLASDDGTLLYVKAAAQPVLRVSPCPQHGSPQDLMRAAYHLGNRHVALEIQADHLKLEPDSVLAAMLRQMGLIVTEACEPFEPEAGAYASHGHSHTHPGSDLHEHTT